MSPRHEPSAEDRARVEAAVGRPLEGDFWVVARGRNGTPMVIENAPFLRDGTPMPTLYWLVDRALVEDVSRLEGGGGVHRFEEMVDPDALERTHRLYARRRDARGGRRPGPAPTGGVGGTRRGVKCLHAHLANFLVGADDPVGALVARRVAVPPWTAGESDDTVAVIDCGSNSTRLLVDARDGEPRREMRITRLGEGVDARGRLAPDALARVAHVLDLYADLARGAGVDRGLVVATAAVRDAANREEFLEDAARRTGFDVRVITGRDEAALSYAGATADLADDPRPTVIVDVGGGSTEIATRLGGRLLGHSMQLGCVRVTERALGASPTRESRDRADAMIARELEAAMAALPELAAYSGPLRVVGLAGTVATLAQLDAGRSDYDRAAIHHRILTRDTVRAWADRLAALAPVERLALAGMVPGREDVLVAGLLVLDAVLERLGASEVIASEADILDGTVAWLRGVHQPDTMEVVGVDS